jgi:hypothetical protein
MEERKGNVWANIWCFAWQILLIAALALAGAAASFLITGTLTARAYSNRAFLAGIACIIIGGMGILASLGSYSTVGVTNVFTAPGDAPIAHSRIAEHMRMNAGRYTFVIRMLAAGALCMVVAALIDILSR